MISTLLAAAALAGGFQHPTPSPPADLAAADYRERRERLMKALDGCIAVIGAQGEASGITEDYRQDADFYWLTGINEPGAFLVFAPKAPFNKVTLFLKPRDPEAERWTGPREPISPELKERYGVDRVRRGSPDTTLEGAGENHDCVSIIAPPSMAKEDRNDAELAARVAQRFGLRLVHQRSLLAGLREVHSAAEIERMERAIAITRTGHEAIAKGSVAGVSERDLQTQMEYAFFSNGATGLSYSSIVGSGPNGAVLHWDQNSRLLKDGDLVVVDAAAEYGRYAADVTRTYPVSGKFGAEQAKVYRAVYQAQEDILAAIRPGVSMAELQHVAEESLRRAGYLKDFIHGFGHFVGLDVHDAGLYEKPLPVGAIFTVEPGVYLPERGFGVRIEDEVIVTPTGYRLLTAAFPRKLEDVETWVAKARR
ncbi:MAG TPA: Xaa-Pro peptidase family protein [Steroidobacteraceae bacterium]|jgi:Xaa-Pro aminopeptidase|nr:Xaa-Pro peptidase family protein [Steroidobacteraceae bacterium]